MDPLPAATVNAADFVNATREELVEHIHLQRTLIRRLYRKIIALEEQQGVTSPTPRAPSPPPPPLATPPAQSALPLGTTYANVLAELAKINQVMRKHDDGIEPLSEATLTRLESARDRLSSALTSLGPPDHRGARGASVHTSARDRATIEDVMYAQNRYALAPGGDMWSSRASTPMASGSMPVPPFKDLPLSAELPHGTPTRIGNDIVVPSSLVRKVQERLRAVPSRSPRRPQTPTPVRRHETPTPSSHDGGQRPRAISRNRVRV